MYHAQWWIQDFQKGGHKIMDACCLSEHTFLVTKTKKGGRWSKKSASPKRPFFFFFGCFMSFPPLFEYCHFHFRTWQKLFSLKPHPPLLQKRGGGEGYYTCIFISYGATPKCLKCLPRSTYELLTYEILEFGALQDKQ